MPVLALRQLQKEFPRPGKAPFLALAGIDLEVAPGERVSVVGPSGSGKTTLLRLIAGLDRPTSGEVYLENANMGNVPPERRPIALMFQQSALFPHLSAAENLTLGLRLRGMAERERTKEMLAIAELLDIPHLLERLPHALSAGERQRVALGRALLRRPTLLLLDEPLASLDAPMRLQLREVILRCQKEMGFALLLVTHDQAEAMAISHRVLVLNCGRPQQVGAPEILYLEPRNLFVAGFIGMPPMNLFRGHLVQDARGLSFQTADGVLPLSAAPARIPDNLTGERILGCRPEDVECLQEPGLETLPSVVAESEVWGADTFLTLKGSRLAPVVARVSTSLNPPVTVREPRLPWAKLHWFDPTTTERSTP